MKYKISFHELETLWRAIKEYDVSGYQPYYKKYKQDLFKKIDAIFTYANWEFIETATIEVKRSIKNENRQ